jgi:putative hemolysin
VNLLLVVSNHPGAYDILILITSLFRDDLKILSSDITIIRHLPSVAPHFITITHDPYRRMVSFRTALRHLRDGKALLVFPRGEVETDPALSAGALDGIDRWSPSLDLLSREIPQICSVVAIVSGVFSSRWFNHPILRMWKKPEQRQKIAEIARARVQLAAITR